MVEHLSHSQLTTWAGCGERYRLERVLKLPQLPGWALIGGSTLHEMTENYDKARLGVDIPQPSFDEIFDRRIEAEEEKSGIARSQFKASGRASKACPNKEDGDWWREHGPAMFNRWVVFTNSAPWDIWIDPNGNPAIEVKYELYLANGEVKVLGFIDRVMVDRQGRLIILDIKTGASKQATPRQLGTYRVGIEDKFPGEKAHYGAFWDARSGTTTPPAALNEYTPERLEYQYAGLKKAKELGLYIANPGSLCGSCGVNRYCYEFLGEDANSVRPPWVTPEEWGDAA